MDKKAIWIDLDNSPHVPLFVPIIRHYREKGVEVLVTARRHSQTTELLELAGLGGTYYVVGRHYGKSKVKKVLGMISRTWDLLFVCKLDIAIALSHGSRSMVFAALAPTPPIPTVTMYDYEFTETRIFNKLSEVVLVPDAIPDDVLDEIGLPLKKRRKYPGIKEELYVRSFLPTPNFRERFAEEHGFSSDAVIAILRPPASTANYYARKSDVLLDGVLHFLLHAPGGITVVVPRTGEQATEIQRLIDDIPGAESRCVILRKAVDGLELAAASDLLISGGGTMNREAALLGVPVYSIFAGRQGALDRQMEADGRITFIRDARDLSKIRLERRQPGSPPALTDRVERFVIQEIDNFL